MDSGLFNGLQRIQIKKILSPVTAWRKYHRSPLSLLRSRRRLGRHEARALSGEQKYISIYTVFPQPNAQKSNAARQPPSRRRLCAAQDQATTAPGGSIQLHLRGKSVETPSNGPFTCYSWKPPFRGPVRTRVSPMLRLKAGPPRANDAPARDRRRVARHAMNVLRFVPDGTGRKV